MSEYQYYEFCKLNKPLSQKVREKMRSLSSRARISTHGASYVYHYGDFRGDSEKLVLKYFDVFFYISNFGTIRLLFKYSAQKINVGDIKQYCIKPVISIKKQDETILLGIHIHQEEGFGWTEGEGVLADLLPLYDEIKAGNYQFLRLVSAIHSEWRGKTHNAIDAFVSETPLSSSQEAFLQCVGIEYEKK